MKRHVLTVLLAGALLGCASAPSEREMNYLASALTKVSAAVDATVRYRRTADGLGDAQLLQAATAHDPGLLKPFEGYTLKVARDGRDSAVLVCKAQEGAALLEDAGCTARMDAHRWSQPTPASCDFSLDIKRVCAR